MAKWTKKKLDREYQQLTIELRSEQHTLDLVTMSLKKYKQQGNDKLVHLVKVNQGKIKIQIAHIEHQKAILRHEYVKLGLTPPSH